jgi:hypothetical protein
MPFQADIGELAVGVETVRLSPIIHPANRIEHHRARDHSVKPLNPHECRFVCWMGHSVPHGAVDKHVVGDDYVRYALHNVTSADTARTRHFNAYLHGLHGMEGEQRA